MQYLTEREGVGRVRAFSVVGLTLELKARPTSTLLADDVEVWARVFIQAGQVPHCSPLAGSRVCQW